MAYKLPNLLKLERPCETTNSKQTFTTTLKVLTGIGTPSPHFWMCQLQLNCSRPERRYDILSVRCWQPPPPPIRRDSTHVILSSHSISPAGLLTSDGARAVAMATHFPTPPSLSSGRSTMVQPASCSTMVARWWAGGESDSASADLGSVHLCFFTFPIAYFLLSFSFLFVIVIIIIP